MGIALPALRLPRLLLAALATSGMAILFPSTALALDPEEYDDAVRRFAVWLVQTTDPTTFHPAAPVGTMPFEVPMGHPLPEFYGFSASYGASQYHPSGDVSGTLSTLTQGVAQPSVFRSNKLTFSLGLSRTQTVGIRLLQYPAFNTLGGGLHYETLLFGEKPVYLAFRATASRAAGSSWFEYTGVMGEWIFGLHWPGFDLFAGVGTRLARLRLSIANDPASGDQWIFPYQRESLETHVGAEIFLTRKLAIGGGIHFQPEGTGFGVRLTYKSRGTSTLIDPYLGRRRE